MHRSCSHECARVFARRILDAQINFLLASLLRILLRVEALSRSSFSLTFSELFSRFSRVLMQTLQLLVLALSTFRRSLSLRLRSPSRNHDLGGVLGAETRKECSAEYAAPDRRLLCIRVFLEIMLTASLVGAASFGIVDTQKSRGHRSMF